MKILFSQRALNLVVVGVLALALPASALASFSGILPLASSGSMPAPLAGPVITFSNSNLSIGQTATVTFTFPAKPISFTTGDITAPNGTISSLAGTADPKVYTATFTPSATTNAPTNVIRVRAKLVGTTYSGTGSNPTGIAFDGTNMWTANEGSTNISQITPSGVITNFSGFDGPSSIAFDGANLWVTNFGSAGGVGATNGTTANKVGLDGSIIGSPITIGRGPIGIAFDGSNMWTTNAWENTVSEINSSGVVVRTPSVGSGPFGIAFGSGNMWVPDSNVSSVSKISSTGTVTTYSGVGSYPFGIAFDGTSMWVSNEGGDSVSKVSSTGSITTYSGTGPEPYALAFDGTNMWTVNNGNNTVTEVAPDGTMATYFGTGSQPESIAYDGTNMWVANYGSSSVTKISGAISSSTSSNYSINTTAHTPIFTSIAASGITATTSSITWNTDYNSSSKVIYSTDFSYSSTTTETDSSGVTSHAQTLTDLSPCTSYNYEVVSGTMTYGYATSTSSGFTTTGCVTPSVTSAHNGGGISGGSVTSQVANLIAMGNTIQAQKIQAQWPGLFPSPTSTPPAVSVSTSPVFIRQLKAGMIGGDVLALQQYLNSHGFPIATVGSGSSGQETKYFGTLTRDALLKFQEAHVADILAPLHLSHGTGVLGSATIAFITKP